MGEGSKDEWGAKGEDWEWDDGSDEKEQEEKKKEDERKQKEYLEKKKAREEEQKRKLVEEEEQIIKLAKEEKKRRQDEDAAVRLEAARKAKELEAANLRETLSQDDQNKFDEMMGRGMLLSQIILHFLNGGAEEETKEELKEKIRRPVQIENVDNQQNQNIVLEPADKLQTVTAEIIEKKESNEIVVGIIEEEIKNEEWVVVESDPKAETENVKSIECDHNDQEIQDKIEEEITIEPIEKNKDHEQGEENNTKCDNAESTVETEETEHKTGRQSLTDSTHNPTAISVPDSAQDLEQHYDRVPNNTALPQDVPHVADDLVSRRQSVQESIYEDVTLIQDIDISEMAQEGEDADSSSLEYPSSVGQGQRCEMGQDKPADESSYVSIVDRMLGMSAPAKSTPPPTGTNKEEEEVNGVDNEESSKRGSMGINDKYINEGSTNISSVGLDDRNTNDSTNMGSVAVDNGDTIEKSPSAGSMGLKVAMDRVLREKSAAKEMSVPR